METKQCSICGLEKPLTDFAFRDKTKGTYRTNCRKCQSQIVKDRYDKNKDILNQTKIGKCCEKCGYNRCVEALDYHHIDPNTKLDTVARLATHFNIETALEEIKKCSILCANCHREYHYLQRTTGITLKDFLK